MSSKNQKGFISVVAELQHIILENHLEPGDKLPSERYLSEKMNISRSSIREALRALELIGVIKTKRGEGTFLTNIDEHQLFELIGGYLIHSQQQTSEIKEFKDVLESHLSEHPGNSIMTRVHKLLGHYHNAFNHQGDDDV